MPGHPPQNAKAQEFVERSEIKVLGALSAEEIQRYLREASGLPVSAREGDMLADWGTLTGVDAHASAKGIGKFLIKVGGLPRIPISVDLYALERSGFNDTNRAWRPAPSERSIA